MQTAWPAWWGSGIHGTIAKKNRSSRPVGKHDAVRIGDAVALWGLVIQACLTSPAATYSAS